LVGPIKEEEEEVLLVEPNNPITAADVRFWAVEIRTKI
jgi:hypothetical protein